MESDYEVTTKTILALQEHVDILYHQYHERHPATTEDLQEYFWILTNLRDAVQSALKHLDQHGAI